MKLITSAGAFIWGTVSRCFVYHWLFGKWNRNMCYQTQWILGNRYSRTLSQRRSALTLYQIICIT